MARLAAVSIVVMLGFRGFEGWDALEVVLGPLIGYSPPVVLGMLGLCIAATVSGLRALERGAEVRAPGFALLLLGLVAVYCVTWLLDVAAANESPRGQVVILELLVAIAFTTMVYLAFRTEQDVLLLQRAIVIAALGVGAYLLYRATFLPEPALRLGTFSRANYADLSYLLAAALWVGPISRFVLSGPRRFAGSLPQVAVLLGAGLLTGTRAGIWTVLMFAPLLLVVLKSTGSRRAGHWLWFIPATLALGWSLVELLSSRAVVDRGFELFSFNRGELWVQAAQESTDSLRALLLGAGTGAFDITGDFAYPHNLLLEVQYNGGILATLLVCALLAVTVLRVWGRVRGSGGRRMQHLAVPALGLGVVALVGALVTYEAPSNLLLWIFVAMSARMHTLAHAPARVPARTRRRALAAGAVQRQSVRVRP